jgi:hypothetical protein
VRSLIIVVIIVCTLLSLHGCSRDSAIIKEANRLADNGDASASQQTLIDGLTAYPASTAINNMLYDSYITNMDFINASVLIDTTHAVLDSIFDTHIRILHSRAIDSLYNTNTDTVDYAFLDNLELFGKTVNDSVRYHMFLANIHKIYSDYEREMDELRICVELDDTDVYAYYRIASNLVQNKRYEDAINVLDLVPGNFVDTEDLNKRCRTGIINAGRIDTRALCREFAKDRTGALNRWRDKYVVIDIPKTGTIPIPSFVSSEYSYSKDDGGYPSVGYFVWDVPSPKYLGKHGYSTKKSFRISVLFDTNDKNISDWSKLTMQANARGLYCNEMRVFGRWPGDLQHNLTIIGRIIFATDLDQPMLDEMIGISDAVIIDMQ